jgi:hypothetical protein
MAQADRALSTTGVSSTTAPSRLASVAGQRWVVPMADSGEPRGGPVVGVLGGSGGVGASSFAAVLARAGHATLVDLDPVGGGVDVLLGVEEVPGARWSGLRLDGGYLDPQLLAEGLPRWNSVPVLAADGATPSGEQIGQVLGAARSRGPVVLDLPRAPTAERDLAARRCALTVVVVSAQLRPLAAAQAVVCSLPDVAVGLVICRGAIRPEQAAVFVGAPLLGVLRQPVRPADSGGSPRAAARVADGILDGLCR